MERVVDEENRAKCFSFVPPSFLPNSPFFRFEVNTGLTPARRTSEGETSFRGLRTAIAALEIEDNYRCFMETPARARMS
jgi:hypothetical protein